MEVNVHIGLALVAMRELCNHHEGCVDCPLSSFCRSTNGFVPSLSDPNTYPNLIVKVALSVDKL